MTLFETIEGMVSEDYKERFKAEFNQLTIRARKLKETIEKYERNELPFIATCDIDILREQLEVMNKYRSILIYRAYKENITLLPPEGQA